MENLNNFKKIIAPVDCPSCGSSLELVKDQLFCRDAGCDAKSTKQVEHFVKVMKIKGLGPKTIERLELTSIPDVYNLTEAALIDVLGEVMGPKIYNSIEASKTPEACVYMSAFSIPLFGNSAAKKVGKYVASFDALTSEVCEKAGIGQKATSNVLDWIEKVWKGRQYNELLSIVQPQGTSTPASAEESPKELGITVVITGKLNDFKNRSDAQAYLTSLGYTVKSGVTASINYLIDEEGRSSSSTKKADSLKVPRVSIKELVHKTQNDIISE